jgi:hypothetical protein
MRSLHFLIESNPSSRTMTLWLTQPLTELYIRNLPGSKGRPTRKPDNPTAMCRADFLENVEASASHNPMDLHGLLQGWLCNLCLVITDFRLPVYEFVK